MAIQPLATKLPSETILEIKITKLRFTKSKDILIQEAKDDTLIYNLQNDQVRCLNKTDGIIRQLWVNANPYFGCKIGGVSGFMSCVAYLES